MDTNSIPTVPAQDDGMPKKYIRTFASDMDTFKKGGVPGFTPLIEVPPSKEEPVVEKAPPPEPPPPDISVPLPEPEPEPAPMELPEGEAEEVVLPEPEPEPLLELDPLPKPESEPEPEPEPVVTEEESRPLPLQTYEDDFRERLKETQASTVTVLAAEQDARPVAAAEAPRKAGGSGYAFFVALLSILLLGGGGVGVYFAFLHYQVATAPVVIAPTISAPIVVDDQAKVSGTGSALARSIEQSVVSPLAPNAIRLLTLDTAGEDSVFLALTPPAPNILLRNVNATGGMAGIINTGASQSPFFILSVSGYDATFSGMLSWEPHMETDLAVLFPLYPTQDLATSSAPIGTKVGTTTASTTTPNGGFHDEVVSNHDVRVYRDTQGRSILLYGYWNQNVLIIARDPAAFSEIVGRLASHA